MKLNLGFYCFTACAILFLPSLVLLPQASEGLPMQSLSESANDTKAAEAYRVLDSSTGEILTVPLRDYLIGAVCAEMPVTFEPEALKAQVIAIHTYAERIRRQNKAHPDPSLLGADFSNDSSKYQAYYTESQLRSAYGDSYEECYRKAAEAVDAVKSELIFYEDEPIIAAFHAISSGKTESSDVIWGEPLSYLTSVDSAADITAPRYSETVSFSPDALKAAVLAAHPDFLFPDEPAAWLEVLSVSDAGTVLSLKCGSGVLSGQQLREICKLRSAAFSVSYADGAFSITTKGYGHAVGMSQYGANEMAKQGADYGEILSHYYPSAVLRTVS